MCCTSDSFRSGICEAAASSGAAALGALHDLVHVGRGEAEAREEARIGDVVGRVTPRRRRGAVREPSLGPAAPA